MNYIIDFDNTIFETGRLTKDVLNSLAETIVIEQPSLNKEEVLDDIKKSFNSTIDNFFTFASSLHKKYNVNKNSLYCAIYKKIIIEGKNYVFPDALEFLKKLHDTEETVCILTYVAQPKNLSQQALKLSGSGILEYVTEVYNSTRYKFELEHIDFKNAIVIEDSPRDLKGFYQRGAKHLYRMIKPSNEKRTSQPLDIPIKIPTVTSFNNIPINIKSLEL